jgi:hypothetical protein
MKADPFYERALRDAGFRQAKLDDLRYFLKVDIGLLVLGAILCVSEIIHSGLKHGNWFGSSDGVVWIVIPGALYAVTSTKIAALEAIDRNSPSTKTGTLG